MTTHAIPNPKKTIQVDFPLESIRLSVKNINLISSKYDFTDSNEIFNQYTYSALEFLSFGVFVDINLNSISEYKTEITVEIRRKIGSFNQSHEISRANDHIVEIFDCIAKLTSKSQEEIETLKKQKIDKLKSSKSTNKVNNGYIKYQGNSTNSWFEKKWLVILLIVIFFPIGLYALWKNSSISTVWKIAITFLIAIIIVVNWGDDSEIGIYTKEELPIGFSYNIISDQSNQLLKKNQFDVELSEKLSEGQLATLAEELYKSKTKQRRFYIFYKLKGVGNDNPVWATSHFDPDLKINFIGSSTDEDSNIGKLDKKIDGVVIGKWYEIKYTSSRYIIYKKDNKIFLKIVFKSGQISDEELKESKKGDETRYDFKAGGFNGEYFVINNENCLEFYNSENTNFTTATP